MIKQKGAKMNDGFSELLNREEFLRLPRIEFLLNDIDAHLKNDLGKIVTNHSFESVDRFSMTVPDGRMADAGLCKGDHVIVQKKQHYDDGNVLAVKLGERIFIRRYFRSANRIRLECNTPDRQSMILDKKTPGFSILGNVIQVIREI